jgi:hypothetical protein
MSVVHFYGGPADSTTEQITVPSHHTVARGGTIYALRADPADAEHYIGYPEPSADGWRLRHLYETTRTHGQRATLLVRVGDRLTTAGWPRVILNRETESKASNGQTVWTRVVWVLLSPTDPDIREG